ncbi:MAG TPA: TIGR03435 family protein [Bryobacteraceae bacterium]|jgi:uncharacterized protein (TIGR03435 family)|nr:TIGR03435 family protein [Bryobacteraceae bacterium]
MRRVGTGTVVFALACAVFARGGDSFSFEVASVKQSPPVAPGQRVYFGPARGGPGTADPGQITWTYARFIDLLMTAYDVKSYQINGPTWINNERYDVLVKVPADASKDQVRVMWQNLLAERFGLKLHHESREFRVEELVVAKGGPKLKETVEDPTPPLSGEPPKFRDGVLNSPGFVLTISPGASRADIHAFSRAQPLSKLTGTLGNMVNRPVLDKTGLTGNYDFTLEFSIDMGRLAVPAPGDAGDGATDPGSDVESALQDQLGLRLVAAKATLDVLVIDAAEKMPTAN